MTASYATCKYLKEHYEDKKLLVVGTPSFEDELKSFGLKLTHEAEEDVACVVVGFDRTLVYEKVEEACKALFRPEVVLSEQTQITGAQLHLASSLTVEGSARC